MKYKIGNVARMLGIAPQTIRHYELEGLVRAVKDETTGYRFYEPMHINVLLQTRMLRNLGFSLAEASHILNDSDSEEALACMQDRRRQLRDEIVWCERMIACIEEQVEEMQQAQARSFCCEMQMRPAFYGLLFRHWDEIDTNREVAQQVSEWSDYMPMARLLHKVPQSQMRPDCRDSLSGLCLPLRYAEMIGYRPDERAFFVPEQMCLHTFIHKENSTDKPWQVYFAHVFDYLAQHGLRVSGDVYGMPISLLKRQSQRLYDGQMWIPVEKA